jgi:hypothetical protein
MEARERLFAVAVALAAAKHGEVFPTEGEAWEAFFAAGRCVCPGLVVVRPGGEWPADLLGRAAVLVAADGSAMLLMTEMLRPGAFGESPEDQVARGEVLPEIEVLAIGRDGSSQLGASEAAASLLALAPRREDRG